MENENITRIIKIGTVASKIPENQMVDDATHIWKAYVKSADGSPMTYIQSIVYRLHETFLNPIVETTHPFVIENRGWGEFKLQIRINFVDPAERSLTFTHQLKLYGEKEDEDCINERWECIVFRSPTNNMYRVLKGKNDSKGVMGPGEIEEGKKIDNAIKYMLDRFHELEM
ncbi:Protein AF-9 like protein [Astathelohania contejeani]|uniref:Protein AF-9 like protein n=1 Tax=Astathelohania contejeani TaxID=164912 RepID=A0ABQ7HZ49_9MICR|nr:Protein AF-9 like protein [Thelohania contejeani]